MNSYHKNAFFMHERFSILDISFLSLIITTDIIRASMETIKEPVVPSVKKHIRRLA